MKPNAELTTPNNADLVQELMARTGLDKDAAKGVVQEAAQTTLGKRYLRALLTQVSGSEGVTSAFILHDPIEDEPQLKRMLDIATAKANRELSSFGLGFGLCHIFWASKKQILQGEYGIEWFSPAEMNPNICFD